MPTRSRHERIADIRRRLAEEPNIWVATASTGGVPHLVPLWLVWSDERAVVCTPVDNPTARNAAATGRARVARHRAAADNDRSTLDDRPANVEGVNTNHVGWT